jgi:endoglucanase
VRHRASRGGSPDSPSSGAPDASRSSRPAGPHPLVAVLLVAVVALVSGGLVYLLLGTTSQSPAPTASPPTTAPPVAPGSVGPGSGVATTGLHTSGAAILAPDGQRFAPYGFVLECLAMQDLSCEHPSDPGLTDSAKIEAAASFWHANAVRLQVAQEHLFSSSPYDTAYLAALDSEVQLANHLGMVVSITLQEEDFSGPPLPTASAEHFWTFMARHFASSPGVVFDLYNEPKLLPYQGQDWLWNIWRNGGQVSVNGVDDTFVGMQALVDAVRATGADNLIVAEGNGNDHDLTEVTTHLLTGGNIAYGFEPNLKIHSQTPAQWDTAFGDASATVPLVMDAFRDYATGSDCLADTPTVLPQLFAYLVAHHLGLLVWTLDAGNTFVGANPDQPTSYPDGVTQLCVPHDHQHRAIAVGSGVGYNPDTNTNGPGADILGFFRAHSATLTLPPPA